MDSKIFSTAFVFSKRLSSKCSHLSFYRTSSRPFSAKLSYDLFKWVLASNNSCYLPWLEIIRIDSKELTRVLGIFGHLALARFRIELEDHFR